MCACPARRWATRRQSDHRRGPGTRLVRPNPSFANVPAVGPKGASCPLGRSLILSDPFGACASTARRGFLFASLQTPWGWCASFLATSSDTARTRGRNRLTRPHRGCSLGGASLHEAPMARCRELAGCAPSQRRARGARRIRSPDAPTRRPPRSGGAGMRHPLERQDVAFERTAGLISEPVTGRASVTAGRLKDATRRRHRRAGDYSRSSAPKSGSVGYAPRFGVHTLSW
jgi:hypothetical protein